MYKDIKTTGLSSFALSALAAVSMTVDHAAAVFAAASPVYYVMRAVGRIAFVIFAFLIAQSVDKTSSIKRFCLRLAVFAVISEPIFDMAFYGRWIFVRHQNIFFTLLAGVIGCSLVKRRDAVSTAAAMAVVLAAQLVGTDYGGVGVLLILAFYLLEKTRLFEVVAVFAAVCIVDGDPLFYAFALAAVPLIKLYNGSRGGGFAPKLRKWIFYIYYPAHLAFLIFIRTM